MPIVDYRIPIGGKYGQVLPFAEEREDIKVGAWVWMRSGNNRFYPPYANGTCIIEGHYEAFCVVKETNTHWHVSTYPEGANPLVTKVKKASLETAIGQMGASSFFTHNEMLDAVWLSYNRLGIERALGACRSDEALAKVLESIDGCGIFDYTKYLQQEGRRRSGPTLPLGEAIRKGISEFYWPTTPERTRAFIYRNIANAIGYVDVEHSDLKLWQEDREKRG